MTTNQFNDSVTDSIHNLVALNKAKEPTSFSQWLEQNGDSIEDIGGNFTPDRIAANNERYSQQGERAFDGEDTEEWMRRSEQQGE